MSQEDRDLVRAARRTKAAAEASSSAAPGDAQARADFLTHLRKSNLLDAATLRDIEADEKLPSEPRNLAAMLTQRGSLTPWQAKRLLAGETGFFFGKYKLLAPLGQGGMGSVFKAEQQPLGRVVAIKLMAKELVNDPDAVVRFQREIQTAAALSDPHIVHAFDADCVKDSHFLIMEYVDGEDLGDIVRQSGPLPVGTACEYIRQAALGLQHAHEREMIHRDIKPSNLLVTQQNGRPLVKILDFGLAKFRSEKIDDGNVTRTGQIMGTPDYIAPEQAESTKSADIRSDIYSLGCTLYRLLTGQVPFPGDNVMKKLMARMTNDPAPLSTFRDDVPAELEAVLNRMLARDVDDRYQTPAEVAAALSPFAQYSGGDEDTLALTASLTAADDSTEITDPGYRAFVNNLATEIVQEPVAVRPRESASLKKSLGDRKTLMSMIGAAVVLAGIGIFVAFGLPDRTGKADPSDATDNDDRQSTVVPTDEAESDRATAEWLRKEFKDVWMTVYRHGREELKQKIGVNDSLPKEPFRIFSINLQTIRRIERADLERLASLKSLKRLAFSNLVKNDLEFAALPVLKDITFLHFGLSYLDDTAFPHIAKLSKLEDLRIGVDRSRITQKGLNQLGRLKNLKKLFFHRVPLAGMRFDILKSISGLIQLHIAHGGLRDADLKSISEIAPILRLELEHDEFTDDGLFHLRKLPNLNSIGLRQLPGITARCLRHFETFPKLRTIRIKAKNVTTADLKQFKVRHPDWSVAPGLGYLKHDPKLLYSGDWYDLLAATHLEKSSEGLAPVTGSRGFPVKVHGDYVVRASLTRMNDDAIDFGLPFGSEFCVLRLHKRGTQFNQHREKPIRGEFPIKNTTLTTPIAKRLEFSIRVRGNKDDAELNVQLNGKPYFAWRGKLSSAPAPDTLRLRLGINKGAKATWHEFHLQPLDKPARLNGKLPGPRFKTARDLIVPDWAVAGKPVRTIAAGEMIDLVPHVDPWEDSVQGNWGFRDGKLTALQDGKNQHHIFAPVDIHGDYDMEIAIGGRYTASNGNEWMALVLPAGNRVFRVIQEAWKERFSGLEYVKGKDVRQNGLGTTDDIVKPGQKSIIRIKVRTKDKNSTITATINGKKIIDWTGPTDDLAMNDQYWWRYKPAFFTIHPGMEVESAKLTMVSGEAKLYRNRPPITAPPAQRQYALSFDGKDDYVEIPSFQYDDGPVTIEAVVSSPGGPGSAVVVVEGKRSVLSIWDSTGVRRGGGSTGISHFDGKTELVARTNFGTHLNRTHLAAVYDGTGVSFYINGVKTTNPGTIARPISIDGKPSFQIGKSLPGKFFQGRIEELRVSKGARYKDNFIARQLLEKDANTLALYHFDEGQGDVLTDHSGNAHHGKIHGATWVNIDGTPAELPRDYALSFDGKDDSVDIPGLTPRENATVTFEAWVRLKGYTKASHQTPLQFGHLSLQLFNQGKRWQALSNVRRNGRPDSAFVVLPNSAKVGERMHLACVATPGSLTLFVNGKQAGSVEIPAGANPVKSARQSILGNSVPSQWAVKENRYTRLFHGDLDEVRISAGKRYVKDFTPIKRFTPDKDTIALYHFDEGTGDVLKDHSGNGHHGKIHGATWVNADGTPIEPKKDFALSFDGKDDYIDISSLHFDARKPFTIEAWIDPIIASQRHIPVSVLGPRGGGYLMNMPGGPNGIFYYGGLWSDRNGSHAGTGPKGLAHIALVSSPEGLTLFINGKKSPTPPKKQDRSAKFKSIQSYIGVRRDFFTNNQFEHWFKGTIHAVRVSSVARYTDNFQLSRRFTPDKGTLALYHFDEGTGDVLKDHSGNNHHGKIQGATWVNADGAPIQPKKSFALSFDGNDDSVEIPSLTPSGKEPVTIEAWARVKGITTDSAFQNVIRFGFVQLRFHHKGRGWTASAMMRKQDEALWPFAKDKNATAIGNRVHLAAVWTPADISLFVDGRLVGVNPLPAGATPDLKSQKFVLGRWVPAGQPGSANGFLGDLDQVRISKGKRYLKDFTPDERFTSDKDTLALYRFERGFGTFLKDHSGKNHHGKIHGATWVNADGTPLGSDGVLWNGYEHDVLAMIEPPKGWTKSKEGLKATVPKRNASIQIPIECTGSYHCRVWFKRMTGSNSVNLLFPVGRRVCQVVFDGYDKHLSTLGPIGGKQGADSPVKKAGIALKNGRPYRASVVVGIDGGKATILINLNSQPELNLKWSGPLPDLDAPHRSGRFNVSSWDGGVLISRMLFIPIGGPARFTGPLPGPGKSVDAKAVPMSQPAGTPK